MNKSPKRLALVALLLGLAFIAGMLAGTYYAIHYSQISDNGSEYIIEYNGHTYIHDKN